MTAVKEWGDMGAFEGDEFYHEVHFLNMQRLYNLARGRNAPGRPQMRAIKK